MTSAVNCRRRPSVAVRQTPLTATESPSDSSPASVLATRRRTPSAVASIAGDGAQVATSPVNTVTTPSGGPTRARRRRSLDVEAERARRLGNALGALALERVAGARAAEHDGGDEEADLVDLAGVEEAPGQARPALEQDPR
jgi:hypothetical protein